MIGLENLRSVNLSNQCETYSNSDLITRVFPRFRSFLCLDFDLSSHPRASVNKMLENWVYSLLLLG